MTQKLRHRRGLIAVAVLLALIVLGMLLGVLFRSAMLQRMAIAKAERRLQAEALAESGVDRAAAQLSLSDNYTGETWELKATELGRRDDATVIIRIERVEEKPDRRRIIVQADYPRPADRRARMTKTVLLDLNRTKRPDKGTSP